MSKRDFYEVLGVSRNCSEAELKKAYRRAAQKHHPDRNQSDATAEAKFKECKEAFETLNDPHKRAAYDQFGHAGVDPSMGAGFGRGAAGAGGFNDIFGDVFGDIFGGGRGGGGQRVYRGSDLRYNLELSLEDAVAGTEVKIRVPTTGELHSRVMAVVRRKAVHRRPVPPVAAMARYACSRASFRCSKPVRIAREKALLLRIRVATCRGKGRVQERKTLSVKVPAGVDSGDRIRLAGEGEAGENGGPPGDLYVQVSVKEHPIFPARRKQSLLRGADQFRDRSAGR